MRRLLPVLAALVLAGPAHGGTFTSTDQPVTMSDGVQVATTYLVPDGTPPAGGWPAVMIFHGLGQTRNSTEFQNFSWTQIGGSIFAANGYAVLTFDARAHGQSGGLFTVDGPREIQDTKELFAWLTSHPQVDAKHVGAFGVSYGGGNIWASTLAGVPFAAIAPTATWTDLRDALAPNGAARAGIIFGFANDIERAKIPPDLQALLQSALTGQNIDAIRAYLGTRSTRAQLGQITIPTLIMQGRRDFAFDVDQALAAYRLVRGPKRLYVGDFGHAPAANPAPELPYLENEVKRWFDHFLRGQANGAEKDPPIELAHDPWDGKTTAYKTMPATRKLSFALGRSTLTATAKVVKSVRVVPRVETFGAPVVSVTATGSWPRLVAVLSAITPAGKEIVVADGGADTSAFGSTPKTLNIPLQNEVTAIPAHSRLRVTLAAKSTAQNTGNLVYLNDVPPESRLAIRRATLTLSVLAKPVSR